MVLLTSGDMLHVVTGIKDDNLFNEESLGIHCFKFRGIDDPSTMPLDEELHRTGDCRA